MAPDVSARAASPSPTVGELRGFAWTVGGAFAVLAAVAAWRGRSGAALLLGALAAGLWITAAVAPRRLAAPQAAWMRLAHAMSAITTPVLMAAIYFGVLTPLAVVMRLAGRRAIGVPKGAATAWVERPPDSRRSDLRRQF
ncbi:MAG TPA: SxtJ family membrane protein [Gemmatirosa sp.]|nr:SxtJ family membrane protein [Gemmatirosa sp.]